jgi:hypothetical protein
VRERSHGYGREDEEEGRQTMVLRRRGLLPRSVAPLARRSGRQAAQSTRSCGQVARRRQRQFLNKQTRTAGAAAAPAAPQHGGGGAHDRAARRRGGVRPSPASHQRRYQFLPLTLPPSSRAVGGQVDEVRDDFMGGPLFGGRRAKQRLARNKKVEDGQV